MVTNPSNSPENSYLLEDEHGDKKRLQLTYGSTMDNEIIGYLFNIMRYACKFLNRDADFAEKLQSAQKLLPPLKVSERYGTICEWIKDYEEFEPAHRHISHLWGLYPADIINETDPVLFDAAEKTIARRLANGGGATGWSRAWIINFYARLKDGNNAWEHTKALLKNSTAENLFDMHPPFQIDGNFGAVAGITEMLLQSHLGEFGKRIIDILPAIPTDWENGAVAGLKARGNFTVDIEWHNNKPTKLTVYSGNDNTLRIKLKPETENFKTTHTTVVKDNTICADMKKGERIIFTF